MQKGSIRPADLLLGLAVLGLPWWLGGVEMGAYRVATLLICLAWIAHVVDGGAIKDAWAGKKAISVAILCLALFGLIQFMPLPATVVKTLSPMAYEHHARLGAPHDTQVQPLVEQQALSNITSEEWAKAGGTSVEPLEVEPRSWMTLSLHPAATQERWVWFMALWGAFALVSVRSADEKRRSVYLRALIGFCGLIALQGLMQLGLGNQKILWLWDKPRGTHPFGPYINPVHFVGVLEMLLPAVIGFAFVAFRSTGDKARAWGRKLLAVAILLLGITSVFLAGSKSGALLVGLGLMMVFLQQLKDFRWKVLFLGATAGVILATIPLISSTRLGERWVGAFETNFETGLGRVSSWTSGWEAVKDYWITGSGFGSFREVFPMYVLPGEWGRWIQLHNDYLEVLMEGGLITGILILFIAIGFSRLVFRTAKGSLREGRATEIGLLVGVVLLAIHAVWDFNHQIPANALLWVSICGLLVSPNEEDL